MSKTLKKGDPVDGHVVKEVYDNGSMLVEPKVPPAVEGLALGLYDLPFIYSMSDARRAARYVLDNFVPKGEARTISPENLDKLAEGYRLRVFFHNGCERPKVAWKHIDKDNKEHYHNKVLSMLNAKVADAAAGVDFVVSGANGERLTAVSEVAKNGYSHLKHWWYTYSCELRRSWTISAYETGLRVLGDKNWTGGQHERS